MGDFTNAIGDTLARLDARNAFDILLIAAIFYWMLMLIRGTTAMTLLRGAAILIIAAVILAQTLDLKVLDFIIRNSFAGLLVGVLVIFQPEIRRALERLGRAGIRAWMGRPLYDETIPALRDPTPPLHGGAVILRENRVVAAACTLPLSENPAGGHVGTRHRAALGISERTDAVSVVVSEQTGDISLASDGRLVSRLDETRLRATLASLLGQPPMDKTRQDEG